VHPAGGHRMAVGQVYQVHGGDGPQPGYIQAATAPRLGATKQARGTGEGFYKPDVSLLKEAGGRVSGLLYQPPCEGKPGRASSRAAKPAAKAETSPPRPR